MDEKAALAYGQVNEVDSGTLSNCSSSDTYGSLDASEPDLWAGRIGPRPAGRHLRISARGRRESPCRE